MSDLLVMTYVHTSDDLCCIKWLCDKCFVHEW